MCGAVDENLVWWWFEHRWPAFLAAFIVAAQRSWWGGEERSDLNTLPSNSNCLSLGVRIFTCLEKLQHCLGLFCMENGKKDIVQLVTSLFQSCMVVSSRRLLEKVAIAVKNSACFFGWGFCLVQQLLLLLANHDFLFKPWYYKVTQIVGQCNKISQTTHHSQMQYTTTIYSQQQYQVLQVVESYSQEAFLEDSNNKCRLQIHTLAHHCRQYLKLPQLHGWREKLGSQHCRVWSRL